MDAYAEGNYASISRGRPDLLFVEVEVEDGDTELIVSVQCGSDRIASVKGKPLEFVEAMRMRDRAGRP